MRIKSIMTRDVEYVTPQQSLQEAARIMRDADIGMLPVIEGNRLVGAVTDRDITINGTARGLNPQRAHVSEAMTKNVITCTEDASVEEAMQLMKSHQVRRLIVVDGSRQPVGLLSLGDLATRYGENIKVERVLEKISEHRVQ